MAWSKLSRQARGYGAEWDRTRKRIMQRDGGLCQVCLKNGIFTPAHAVDHVVSKANAAALKWSSASIEADANLQAICDPCHKAKTQEEVGKTYTPRPEIGLDGWPV